MVEEGGSTADGTNSSSEVVTRASTMLPEFIGRSFLVKFILSLMLVLALVGVASAFTVTQTTTEITNDIRTEYVGVAEQSAEQIENWRESRVDTTRRLSEFGVMQTGDQQAIDSFLSEEASRVPDDVYRLHYVDLDTETIVASSNDANVGETLNSREAPWLVENYSFGSNGVFVSEAKEAHGQAEVDFVSPVDRGDGSNMALVVQTNFDEVAADISVHRHAGHEHSGTVAHEQTTFSQVVDSTGRIVAGTRESDQLERNDGVLSEFPGGTDSTVVQQGSNDQVGFLPEPVQYQSLDEPHVRAFAPVSGTDFVVVTHIPETDAFALRSTIVTNLLLLLGTTVLGFVFLAFIFGRGTVSTLNRLTEKARELEAGNLDVDISVKRADEFGTLSAAFANMRNTLRERIEDANQARLEAEQARVQAEEMNVHLEEKAETYSEVMQRCAAGDLTQRMEQDGENEAMDRIAAEFNEMVDELEKTTGQLQTFSDDVIESSEFVQASAGTVRVASEQIADSAQRISSETQDQRDQLEALTEELEAAIDSVEQVAEWNPEIDIDNELDQFREFPDQIRTAIETNDELLLESENVAGAAEEQAAELSDVSERAEQLKRYAQPLGDIVNKFETQNEHEFVFSTGPSDPPDAD